MNKSRVTVAVICLALSALLIVLNLTRPEDELMFMVGDTNMPLVPPIILAVVGLVLLFTARIGRQR